MQLACPDCGSRFRVPQNALGDSGRKVRCAKCKYEWFAEKYDLILDPMDADDAEHMHAEVSAVPEPEPEPEIKSDEEIERALKEAFNHPAYQAAAGEKVEEEKEQWDFTKRKKRTAAPAPVVQQRQVGDLGRYAVWVWIANGATFALLLVMCFYAFRDTISTSIPALKSMYYSSGFADTDGLQLTDLTLTEMKKGSKMRYGLGGKIVNKSDEEQPLPVLAISLVDKDGGTVREWSFSQPGKIKPGAEIPFKQDALENRAGPRNHALVVEIGSATELSLRQ